MMTREEFFEWLETCPTHKWEITHDDDNHIVVSFPTDDRRVRWSPGEGWKK